MSVMACGDCHKKKFEAQPVTACQECHPGRAGLHKAGEHPDLSCTECHLPHAWSVSGRDICLACHDDKVDHNKEDGACAECHDFRGEPPSAKTRSG
jgi:hypothetical protein